MATFERCELSISRNFGAQEGDTVRIVAKRGARKVAHIEVRLTDFAKAVMGELVEAQITVPTPAQQENAHTKAEQSVLAVRGSYDAPGFEACVEAEMRAQQEGQT